MNLIDTHAHLDQVADLAQALQRARQAGVSAVIAVGVGHVSNIKNLEIKKTFREPKIYAALGVHPETVENITDEQIEESLKFIRENIGEAVAVGEVGLDFWYRWARKDEEKKERQRIIFKRQLLLAKEFRLPVVVHSRGAWKDCLDMVKAAGISKALFHWYSGPEDILEEILSCGYFISAGPALSYSEPLQAAVKRTPVENTLIETDCPVFYGQGQGGFRAEPRDVFKVLELYARIKNISPIHAAEIFWGNSRKFFGIA